MIEVAGELRRLYKRWHRQWGPKSPFLLTIPNGGTTKKPQSAPKGKALNNAAMERGIVNIIEGGVVRINVDDKYLPAHMGGIRVAGNAMMGVFGNDGVCRRNAIKGVDDVEHPSSSVSHWIQSIDGKAMQGFVDGDADCPQILEYLRSRNMGNGQSYVVQNEAAAPTKMIKQIATTMKDTMGAQSAFSGFFMMAFDDAVTRKVVKHHYIAAASKIETQKLPPYPLPSPPFPDYPHIVYQGFPQASAGDAVVRIFTSSGNCSVSYHDPWARVTVTVGLAPS